MICWPDGPEHLLFQGRYTCALINPNRLSPQPREQRSHISDARALTIPLPEWTCWLRRSARSLWSLLCCRIQRADVRLVREDLQRGIPKGWFLCGGMPGTYRASGALPGFLVDWATSIHHTTKPTTTTEEAKHCRHTRSRFRREYLAFQLSVKIPGTSDPRLSLPISWLRSRARK